MRTKMTEFLPKWFIWVYSVNGSIYIKHDSKKYLKLTLMILVHILYFWGVINGLKLTDVGTRAIVLNEVVQKTSSILTASVVFIRLIRNFTVSIEVERIFTKLAISEKTIMEKYGNLKFKTLKGLYTKASMILLLIIMFIEIYSRGKSFRFTSTLSWLTSIIKDSLECEFMAAVLERTRILFRTFNRKMEYNYHRTVSFRKFSQKTKLLSRQDEEVEDMKRNISSIRKISLDHYCIVNLEKEVHSILSFNAALMLIKNIISAVNVMYFFVLTVIDNEGMLGQAIWLFYKFSQTCFILHIWNASSEQANKTVILLHDVWNSYADNARIEKSLLYLQLISTRFLSSKVKFTAHGFFLLNWSYIITILAIAVPYIIILFQLRK